MIYIDSKPTPSGAYPNPKNQPFPDGIALNDNQAEIFFTYNGFVDVSENPVTVTPNLDAWNAWKVAHPMVEKAPSLLREEAYNTNPVIEWNGSMLTVTEANSLWQYYAAEGSAQADVLQKLIASAKAEIRERFPDEGGDET